jgi:hypothetical protein
MRFRKLRIAWSVVWGIPTVFLFLLWVRSYLWMDRALNLWGHDLASVHGQIVVDDQIGLANRTEIMELSDGSWGPFADTESLLLTDHTLKRWGDGFAVPHWLVLFVTGAIAFAPWLRQTRGRFTLRALLIATTLVAVLLGLSVYMSGG